MRVSGALLEKRLVNPTGKHLLESETQRRESPGMQAGNGGPKAASVL